MERAGTIVLRVTLVGLPVGLLLLYLALAPDGIGETRVAAAWYGARVVSSAPFMLLSAATGAAFSLWLAVRTLATRRFTKAMRDGGVPARRVKTRDEDHLVARARAALEPALTRRPDLPRLVDALLGTPVDLGAAELTLIPEAFGVQVSLRFGMDRVPVTTMPSETFEAVLERLRMIVGVDDVGHGTIELRGSAGSERIDAHFEHPAVDRRDAYALRLVISRRSGYSRTLEQLGMGEAVLARLGAALEHDKGLIVLAGGNQSGLTTTLYAAAHRLHRAGKHPDALVAIEPHVRLELPFMLQLEVGAAETASVLQHALTHRYQVLLLRKLTDPASASLALQAARERLVIVTLEADGALAALRTIASLADSKLLTETLLLAQGQLLAFKLCRHCRSKETLSDEQRRAFGGLELPNEAFHAQGCERCGGRGVTADRIALFWSLERSPWLVELLQRPPKLEELRRRAFDHGYRGPIERALELAEEGETSIDDALELARARRLG
ncbi:MAG: hypothetical protein CSA65_02030 [Proteobacteria bacterium]|nr:MAG: hypothetical protein CSA65_02030 [Pseudomonadota bacterium]